MNGQAYSAGMVTGQIMVCHGRQGAESHGIWFKDDPLKHFFPVFLVQMVLIFFSTRFTYFLLRPLRQSLVFSQIIAGILLGPTFLDSFELFSLVLFPSPSRCIIRTFAEFGLMFHMFMLGVHIDIASLKKTNKKAIIIAISGFMPPLLLGMATNRFLQHKQPFEEETNTVFPMIYLLSAITSFIVVTDLLSDLKILNSELGRLASSTALVSDSLGWILRFFFASVEVAVKQSTSKGLSLILITCCFYYVLFFIVRPLIIVVIRRRPNEKILDDSQCFIIIVVVLIVGLAGEYLGQHSVFVSFVFGLCLPDGPPLGTHFSQRFSTMTGGLVVPVYFAVSGGLRVNMWKIWQDRASFKVEVVFAVGYLAKILGTMLSAVYFRLPILEATVLGFIMSTKGIMEIAVYVIWMDMKVINQQLFSLLVVSVLIVTGVATPIVASMYDPSGRYMAFIRRSVMDTQQTWDFRILVGVHNEDNVSPILNLLESCNPTRTNPLTVFVIHLIELEGSAAAILAPHCKLRRSNSSLSHFERIVNAFEQLERRTGGDVAVQHFTAVAPYATIHEDICTMAIDKKTNIVIVPFHKHWGPDGEADACYPHIRTMNQNVLRKSPCSVGVLVDRSGIYNQGQKVIVTLRSSYRITMIFLGGPDDFEAMALATRMAEHPNVHLNILLIRSKFDNIDLHNEFLRFPMKRVAEKKTVYTEEIVSNGEGTIQAIRKMEETCDLVIVGKHQQMNSDVFSGLTAWSECPELGPLGDMLATSDFPFSVLVVQQPPNGF